ncbi:glutathione S-transferase family protein [Corallococcus praedator]|uniref:Glutathione S-transferase family protein n=1 Tax=Corallococcus praedator TaxID=2316724 RepID=A0ABX9QKA7_9BACT|nr:MULTISPECIES: glutathione S-transferase N-terminal domain-containing protein [Corallococcus]RKH30603.1 glutathione S-transferase family protein [Corallococcus sp. CA031C]RKI08778.1 glutathione S-transferase family protein [Corallococcus praedator]
MRTLVGLAYSGWTEKARWALDHHRVAYRFHNYVPLIQERWLRKQVAPGVKGSVPLLLDPPGAAVHGSFAIAKRAEELGQGSPLFPPEHLTAITRWNDTSEQVLDVARTYAMPRMLASNKAQAEALPKFVPGWLRGAFAPTARMGMRFVMRKHQVPVSTEALIESTVVPAFEKLRAALGGRPYLEGPFTYADITASVMLVLAGPVADRHLPMGPGTRAVWTHEGLATRFPDLVAWRDALYDKHRRT